MLHKDLAEGLPVDGVGAKASVHHPARVVQGAQRPRRQAIDARRGLVNEESLQNGVRLTQVQVVSADLDQAPVVGKPHVDRLRHMLLGLEPLLDIEQQDLIELGHRLGCPVKASHQHLAGALDQPSALAGATFVTERLGHRRLQVEDQPVLASAGNQVQAGAQHRQQGLVAFDLPGFEGGGQALAGQFVPGLAQASGAGDPQDHLQVPQPAG